MVPAPAVTFIRPALAVWQAYEPSVKVDLTSTARRIGSGGGWALIDPIPLAEVAERQLLAEAAPSVIVLTSGNHARAAESYRQRFNIPIYAHPYAAPGLGLAIDHPLEDGAVLPNGLEAIALPGAAPGEVALYYDGVMHLGDAVVHLPSFGFGLLPDKYCTDPVELRHSLGKLLRFPFEVLTFAHGLPLVAQARQRFSSLLA